MISVPGFRTPSGQQPASLAPRRGDAGVSLVLALVMLIVLSFIFLALASSSINDISNASNLKDQRSIEYAANGAAEMAVQWVRGSGDQFVQGSLQSCLPPPATTVVINEITTAVYCEQVAYNPNLSDTRVINFYACAVGPGVPTCTSANAILYANVKFDDYAPNGGVSYCTPGGNTSSCGTSEYVNSWITESGNNG